MLIIELSVIIIIAVMLAYICFKDLKSLKDNK